MSSKCNRTSRGTSTQRASLVEPLEQRQMLSAAVLSALNLQPQNAVASLDVTGEAEPVCRSAAMTDASAGAATTTAVTSSAAGNTSVYGTAVTFTAAVTGTNPTGTVTFYDGATSLGLGTAGAAGTWTFQTSILRAGSHSITAVYSGDAGNATSTSAVRSATVTAKTITITGITAANKTYDGTTAATLDFSGAVISGLLAADAANITLTTTNAVGTFAGKNAGNGQTVTVTGLALGGSAAGNYSFAQPTATANITPKVLTVTGITAAGKVYDGTTSATITTTSAALSGVLPADSSAVTLVKTSPTGVFDDKNAGAGKTVTVSGLSLSGTASGNYSLAPVIATATISPKPVTVTGATVDNKVYDGTTSASVHTTAATLTGVLAADQVNVSIGGGTGTFASANAGTGVAVTETFTLSGSAAGNYTAQSASATANITPKALTVTGITASKIYDGATSGAALNLSGAALVGVVGGDAGKVLLVQVNARTGNFSSAAAGTNLAVTVSGLSLKGSAARNYTVTNPSITATIAKKPITVKGVTGSDKVYDGTTTDTLNITHATLSGVLAADANHVSLTGPGTGAFSTANVGKKLAVVVSGLALSGTSAGNYTLTQPSTTASITPKALTVTGVTAANKVYDGTTAASIVTNSAVLAGVVAGDVGHVTLSSANASGTFAGKNAGNNIAVTITGLSIAGTAAGNYTLTQPSAAAKITPLALTVTGITAGNKVYDGTTAATLNTSQAVLAGILSGDKGVKLVTVGATGTFADKNAGTGKTVTIGGLSLSGTAASNYTISTTTTTAAITPKTLTVTGVSADKVYDASTTATLNVASAALNGLITGDAASVSLNATGAAVGAFGGANVGTYTLSVSGLALTGTSAGNYTLTQPSLTAHITVKVLSVNGVTASSRTYDGTRNASLDTSGASLGGIVASDAGDVTLVATGASGLFADKNAGTGKTVTVSGLTLAGSAAANYSLGAVTATADITPKAVTMTGITADAKVYDATNAATLDTSAATLTGVLASDLAQVTLGSATGTFADANAGTGKTVTVQVTLGGAAGGNYIVTPPTTTATITAKTLTVTGITANDKAADGTTTATLDTTDAALNGVVPADAANVTLVTADAAGNFSQATAGTNLTVTISGLSLSGSASANYMLTQPTTTASIT